MRHGKLFSPSRLAPHLRGHALLFQAPPKTAYAPAAGLRLLVIFIVLELVLGPRLALLQVVGLPIPAQEIRVPMMLVVALVLVRFAAGVRLSQLGLCPWRQWSTTEKSYFVQVVVAAMLLFALLFADRLRAISALGLATQLAWGFHQELMYRGLLQTELARRWGVAAGVLASNTAYTFGPLHLYHWSVLPAPQAALMFAAIFAIGAFFGVLYARSGNLWMVGVFHGIGDAYVTGLA